MFGGVVSSTVNVVMQVDEFELPSVAVMVIACGPIPTAVPAVGDCVRVTPVQLSLATVEAVKSGTNAWHVAFPGAVCAGAHVVIVGGAESTTFTLVMHDTECMAPSVTVRSTGCMPSDNKVPAGGAWVTVNEQLSLATKVVEKSGVTPMHDPLAGTVCAGAQVVITGDVVSLTVNEVMQVEKLPNPSVTVIVTGVTPRPTSTPATGDCVIVTPVQLSLATTCVVKIGTASRHIAFAEPICGGAHMLITGGVVSETVKLVMHEVELGPSLTVTVTE
jgi:hypothetical protein